MFLCTCAGTVHSPDIATEAMVLSMADDEDLRVNNISEFSISKVINTQFSGQPILG